MNTSSRKLFVSIVLLTIASLLLASCAQAGALLGSQPEATPVPTVTGSQAVSVEGRIVPAHYSALGFLTGGEVASIPVVEGQDVAQGDVLISLGKREQLEAALSAAKLEELSAQQALDDLNEKASLAQMQAAQALTAARKAVIDAQQALDDLDTGAFQEDLDDKNIAVQDAQEELDNAREDLDKYADLDPDNATRKDAQDAYDEAQDAYDQAVRDRDLLQNQLDQANAAVDLAQASLDDAQREVDARQAGPDPDQLALAQARLDTALAQAAAAQRALANMDLTAPYAGTVVDLNDLEPGETVQMGKPAVTLADFSTWYVETDDLTELEVVDVQVGQSVTVVPDALPDSKLTGTVESIDRSYTERSGDVLYTVRIRLDKTEDPLRWGMTVTATFEE